MSQHSLSIRFTKIQLILIILLLNLCITNQLIAQLNWSDPATWTSFGSTKPIAGDNVTIPNGIHILLDENTPMLSGLTINGTLEFDQQDLSLSSDWIIIPMGGLLQIGSTITPFAHQATITLTATDMTQTIMGMGTRGIMVMGGTLELHGNPPTTPYTKLNAHAAAGATTLTLMEPVSWNVNDEIVVGPTDYMPVDQTASHSETTTLTNITGNQLTVNTAMNDFHWGVLQYATTSGISLTATNVVSPTLTPTPTVLDERAPVGNLTRNIVIQAPNDAVWQNDGFGCHIMVMRHGMMQGVAHIDGVEIKRGGQDGNLGRYPFHWHMLSYEDCLDVAGNCQTLPDATGQYIQNSVVNESAHRGIVIHGTNGVLVKDNIIHDVRGHGIFLEDASERRNTIEGNFVIKVRVPVTPLKQHETGNDNTASGFWLSNPDNIVRDNIAADCFGKGFWLAFPTHPFGLSRQVNIIPCYLSFGVFENNTAHSNRADGIHMDTPEIDELGNVGGQQYIATSDGQVPVWPYSTVERFTLQGFKSWKNAGSGIWDRSAAVDNYEAVVADNCQRYFAGSGADGVIERSLVVGTSLNYMMNGYGRPIYAVPQYSAFATYHSEFSMHDNIIMEFPAIANNTSGSFATNDYYLRPVEKGQIRNYNNTIINSHPGVKIKAPFDYHTFAGALWDTSGTWSGTPGNNYLVYDEPFFTYGLTPQVVNPDAATTGGVLVPGPFYGFNHFIVNQANIEWEDLMEIDVDRVDPITFADVGNWNVQEAGSTTWALAHMRHFATHPTGYYELRFPTISTVTDVAVTVENMLTTNDYQVIAVEYSGNHTISQVFTTTYGGVLGTALTEYPYYDTYKHVFQSVNSLQDVINAATGEVYWQDTQNDLVWMKIRGGLPQQWNDADYHEWSDERLYRRFWLRIHNQPLAVLPVELTSFTTIVTPEKQVQLNWKTASEINNDYFEIERSADGKHWETIGKQNGNGTITEPKSYGFLDVMPLPNQSYYRLKQVDVDGQFEYSSIQSVFIQKQEKIQVFPNPVTDNAYLQFDNKQEEIKIQISNAKGQVIMNKEFYNKYQITLNLANLEKGIYFLNIETDNMIETKKLLKQ